MIKTVLVFGNGNIAVGDENGNQIPELQQFNLLQLWAEKAVEMGYQTEGVEIEVSWARRKFRIVNARYIEPIA